MERRLAVNALFSSERASVGYFTGPIR